VRRGASAIPTSSIPVSRREQGNRIHFNAYTTQGGFASQCCSTGGSQGGSFYQPTGAHLSTINDGSWHQYAIVRRFGPSGFTELYLDGVLLPGTYASGTAAAVPASFAATLLIGRQQSQSTGDFTGLLDDIMIFGRALTQAEIIGLP
jgi:hypothetical protein